MSHKKPNANSGLHFKPFENNAVIYEVELISFQIQIIFLRLQIEGAISFRFFMRHPVCILFCHGNAIGQVTLPANH